VVQLVVRGTHGGRDARIREEVGSRDNGWEPPWRLLHGLASIGSPALQSITRRALDRAKKELRGDAAMRRRPDWLRHLGRITATGEVWEMRDAYGARIALIAGFSYPTGVDRSVFLFDVDACGFVEIVHAGVFDDVQQAATAWRALVGDTAQDARPERLETAERLLCLVHCDSGEEVLRGSESRTVLDNWSGTPPDPRSRGCAAQTGTVTTDGAIVVSRPGHGSDGIGVHRLACTAAR
jgi:hypothetical protein